MAQYTRYCMETYNDYAYRWTNDPDWMKLREQIVDLLDDDICVIGPLTLERVLKFFPEREGDYKILAKKFAERGNLFGWDLSGFDFSWLAEPDLVHYSGGKLAPVFVGNKYEHVYFIGCRFKFVTFGNCEFSHCHFYNSVFDGAVFDECDFKSCDFNTTQHYNSSFSGKFNQCDFYDAELIRCEIESTSIYRCRWEGAMLKSDIPGSIRMSEAVIQNIAFSNYQLSLGIRRLNLDPSIKNFNSVFLSHNSQDNEFANRLAGDLVRNGVRVWIDEAELKVGDSLISKVENGIEEMDFLAVILSSNSVKSPWVEKELNIAITMEIKGRKVKVLPILLEDCKIPLFLVDKLFADFREESNYYESLGKILDALRKK